MQITHDTNGDGLPPYPIDTRVMSVNVYMHDSGMMATHDYSCPVCRIEHACLELSCGLMQPCWGCQEKGYKLIKTVAKVSRFERIKKALGMD